MRQADLVTPLAEAVAEAVAAERPLELRFEKGQAAGRRHRDHSIEFRQDRNVDLDRLPAGVLGLNQGEPAVAKMLTAEPNDMRAALPGEQQQRQRQAGRGADRECGLELPHLGDRPGMMALRRRGYVGDIESDVPLQAVFVPLQSPAQNGSEGFQPAVCSFRQTCWTWSSDKVSTGFSDKVDVALDLLDETGGTRNTFVPPLYNVSTGLPWQSGNVMALGHSDIPYCVVLPSVVARADHIRVRFTPIYRGWLGLWPLPLWTPDIVDLP